MDNHGKNDMTIEELAEYLKGDCEDIALPMPDDRIVLGYDAFCRQVNDIFDGVVCDAPEKLIGRPDDEIAYWLENNLSIGSKILWDYADYCESWGVSPAECYLSYPIAVKLGLEFAPDEIYDMID